jgi:hypothetical protein
MRSCSVIVGIGMDRATDQKKDICAEGTENRDL